MPRSPHHNLLHDFNIESPYVTEVRRLLQSLTRQSRDADRRTYVLTSAARGDGKSTACALLSIVAAKVFRKRTLVIDADTRRPEQHHLLGLSPRPGLLEALHGEARLEAVIRPTPIPTLFAITSGRTALSPAEAYRDEEFRDLLAALRPRYELVFVDAPPVLPVVEPLMIAEHTDAILLVVMAAKTPVTLIRRMRQILEPVSSKVAGVILNNASEGLPYYYDYRYYGYGSAAPRRIWNAAPPPPGGEPPTARRSIVRR